MSKPEEASDPLSKSESGWERNPYEQNEPIAAAAPPIKIGAEIRNELIDQIIKTYELRSEDIAETVELFYDCQKLRIMHANKKGSEPSSPMVQWLGKWLETGEKVIHGKLKEWIESEQSPSESRWAYAQAGIGPVLASGLAAHIDVTKADSISSLWRFAGQDPTADRKVKGTKSPYNGRLKTLCWKIGESFVKVSGRESAFYGHWYAKFKSDEVSRNENGLYSAQAQRELANKKIKDAPTKAKLQSGKLTDGHLHARAKRRAVKLFLAHYWTEGRKARNLPVRAPYSIAILKHDAMIEPPV
ncbi:MAG: hypothetical protein DMG76_23710 [Acidobacteria bacterium]|nr:MAG: hypothetical protein DMG76_23710 [Acidobacteriota bacterium]